MISNNEMRFFGFLAIAYIFGVKTQLNAQKSLEMEIRMNNLEHKMWKLENEEDEESKEE